MREIAGLGHVQIQCDACQVSWYRAVVLPFSGLDGTIIVEFNDCETGTITYDIPSVDRQGVIPIERIVPDNVALCEALGAPPAE